MTAVITEARKNEEPTLEDLRTFVARAEKSVQKLDAALAASRCRRDNLTAERGSLVLPARAQKNGTAQKRLYEIDEQLSALDRDIRDDETALTDLTRQLETSQQNLERAEWELQRDAVRKMVEARLTGKTIEAIEKAVNLLETALQTAKEEDDAIRIAAVNFEPRLGRDLRSLHMAGFMRSVLAAWKLQKVLPVDTREFGISGTLNDKTFKFFDHHFYDTLLESLDRLELVF